MYRFLYRFLLLCLSLTSIILSACTNEPESTSGGAAATTSSETSGAAAAEQSNDVIAMVGDQSITYGMLGTMLNSSAVVGLSVPAIGTPQRLNVQVMLLDKVISANLLYLDALKEGVDKDPVYQEDLRRFSDGLLAGLYRMQILRAGNEVTEDEVQAFYENSVAPDTELTAETRMAIEASLRKKKADHSADALREQLRKGGEIKLVEKNLNPDEDAIRSDSDILVTIGTQRITWGEAKPLLLIANQRSAASAGRLDPIAARIEALDKLIDRRLLTQQAKDAGLEQDPVYQVRFNEYKKTRLITFHRRNLLVQMEPSEEEISAYFEKNRDRISTSEERKIQMVVLEKQDEAEAIKQKIESGEMTIYQAAREHSIDPNAKQTLGEMGWVTMGSGFPELDKLTFSLGPAEIGGPVESPAGWHLVKVLDVREAQLQDITDERARKVTRRTMMHERLNEYVVGLRQNEFEVVVYDDRLNQLAKKEAEWVAVLEEKAKQPASLTEQRKEDLEEFMQP